MSRAEAAGDMAAVRGRLQSKYDSGAEQEVIKWLKAVVNEDLVPGMREMEKQLHDGLILLKLAEHVQKSSSNAPEKAKKIRFKVNKEAIAFRQMENIQLFLKFCTAYGVPKGNMFQTVDLYEGRNMAQVIGCIQILGSECQRNGFSGATIGPKPQEKHKVDLTPEQMRAGEGIVGLQAGTNKFASQKGMQFGSVRHGADIRADGLLKEGNSTMILQSGWTGGASQKGMSMGSVRHGADIRADDMTKDGATVIGLQAGSNKFATQAGMTSVGAVRHCADIRADDMVKDSQGLMSQQSGWNKGATQAGMIIGGTRHGADIRADDLLKESQSQVSYQAGWNKGANQQGLSMGSVRHGADIRADDKTREGDGFLSLQMGTNAYASQAGMTQMGAVRHVCDIRADQIDQSGQGVIHMQYGDNLGANQSEMQIGGRRDIKIRIRQPTDV